MEDEDIVDLYWQRSERAIEETATKYGRYCYSIAFNILAGVEDSKECVNDTYLGAWNSIPPHRPAILATFIGKITRRIALNKWRDQHRKKSWDSKMKTNQLIDAIGMIDDDAIFKAKNYEYHVQKIGWKKWGAVAVCLCLLLGAFLGVNNLYSPSPVEAAGVMKVMGYAFDNGQMIEVNLDEGVEIPWNHGWSPGINVVPGLPIKFTYKNQEFSLYVTADQAQLINWKDGKVSVMQQPVLMKSGDTIYWQMRDTDVWAQKKDVHYVNVLNKEQDFIVGYAIIKIAGNTSEPGGKVYVASVIKNVLFPKVNGQYQNITEEYVNAEIEKACNK